MIYIGIDPGKSGALAIIWDGGNIEIVPFDEIAYRDRLGLIGEAIDCGSIDEESGLKCECAVCALEKVGAMPLQGVTSTFNFGHNLGFVEGLLVANEIPYELVTPQRWKKAFSLLKRDKDASIAEARRLFPNVSLLPTERSRKDNDGMAEALLLAEWARRFYRGNRV